MKEYFLIGIVQNLTGIVFFRGNFENWTSILDEYSSTVLKYF